MFHAEEICTNWGLDSSVFATCASIFARKHCGSVHYVELKVKERSSVDLEIVISQKPAVVVLFKPVIKMNLIEIRGHDLLPKFVRFRRHEGDT